MVDLKDIYKSIIKDIRNLSDGELEKEIAEAKKLIKELRICSGDRNCDRCQRHFDVQSKDGEIVSSGCDLLESDAADMIEFLLEVIEPREEEFKGAYIVGSKIKDMTPISAEQIQKRKDSVAPYIKN